MKQPNLKLAALVAALSMALNAAPAWTSRIPDFLVSGTVTSVAGGQQITINGKSYPIQLQGPALQQLRQVQVGQTVDVELSGPPGATSTQVVGINVHHAS